MNKRIYISADYANEDGDRSVVYLLNKWASDNFHSLDFVDMAKVVSGSVSLNNPDCRPCELKEEFNRQINKSSIVVFVVGNKTASRTAGSSCGRASNGWFCTPYKHNSSGQKLCNNGKDYSSYYYFDVNPINSYSYLRHEFEQAKLKKKEIVILYNSSRYETNWLPNYMRGYENKALPFWKYIDYNRLVPNYLEVKRALGY